MRKDRKKTEKLRFLPPEKLSSGPWNARRNFDSGELESLARSIRRYGILQPLTVQKKGGEYRLLCGRRRLEAAKLAGIGLLPCRIVGCAGREAAELSLVENLHRKELDHFEEARAADRLLKHFPYKQGELADRLEESPSRFGAKLRFLRFSPPERSLMEEKGLSLHHAEALLHLRDPATRLFALEYTAEHRLSADACEELCLTLATHPEEFSPSLRPQQSPHAPVRRLVIKDVRLFMNSVDRAILSVQEAGLPIEAEKEEDDGFLRYVICVPKYTES